MEYGWTIEDGKVQTNVSRTRIILCEYSTMYDTFTIIIILAEVFAMRFIT